MDVLKVEAHSRDVVAAWNEIKGVRKCRKLTFARKARLKNRLEEYNFNEVMEALDKVRKSSFLTGDNDRGWRADFDFFVSATKFIKILEGCYDGEQKSAEHMVQY